MNDNQQLTVRREVTDAALVVHVVGEVDLATSLQLGREFVGLERKASPTLPLVVDTTEVTFLASAGLSLLVDLNQRCADAGVDMLVAAGNDAVMRTLETTGLTDLLTVVANLEDALKPAR
ncbi:STAS domain-containing protein [Actinophytocola sp.]|uniref:STAS domain-containing protein n=1 Tax=Actinophytocola sp. TaxID=1872138 RepID=UPI003899926E